MIKFIYTINLVHSQDGIIQLKGLVVCLTIRSMI